MHDEIWVEQNKRFVAQELQRIRIGLELRALHLSDAQHARIPELERQAWEIAVAQEACVAALSKPPALLQLTAAFALTEFECDVIALCAGMELDATLAKTVADIQEQRRESGVTWSFALRFLKQPSWSATLRDAPLRRFGLVTCADASGGVVDQHLRLDERVLNYVLGVEGVDPRLEVIASAWRGSPVLTHDQQALVPTVAAAMRARSAAQPPCIVLNGRHLPTLFALAASAINSVGGDAWVLHADRVAVGETTDPWLRILGREWRLTGLSVIVDGEALEGPSGAWMRGIIERHSGIVIVVGRGAMAAGGRSQLRFDVAAAERRDQPALWHNALALAGGRAGAMDARQLATYERAAARSARHFVLEGGQVEDALQRALADLQAHDEPRRVPKDLPQLLWESVLATCRQSFDGLAQRVEVRATIETLTLEPHVDETLRAVIAHSRHGSTVLDRWGFEERYGRGLGISVLFSGPSGTGKSSAAEIIARELGLELYRIDLAGIVSKWIGETEKNLRKVFDAAECGGGVLLFDEADALFARRTSVSNSHDRYANLEVSYLLQRMEAFQGVTILTTNLADNIDPAFARRLRFTARFAFPDQAARAAIWGQVFPPETPLHALDVAKLAQLRISGANIRSIALAAAFWAAERDQPVTMTALYQASRVEYRKIDQPMTREELAGWPELNTTDGTSPAQR